MFCFLVYLKNDKWGNVEVIIVYFKKLSQYLPGLAEENNEKSWSLGQDFNMGPPENKAGVLTSIQRHSVPITKIRFKNNINISIKSQPYITYHCQ
jgi:hypothetical protein